MSKKNPFDVDGDSQTAAVAKQPPLADSTPEKRDAASARDVDGVPYCPTHLVRMRASSTQGSVTYYRCPVDGCDCTDKTAKRSKSRAIPTEPHRCPVEACAGQPLVVRRINFAVVTMVCPKCGREQQIPNPTINLRRPGAAAAIDER